MFCKGSKTDMKQKTKNYLSVFLRFSRAATFPVFGYLLKYCPDFIRKQNGKDLLLFQFATRYILWADSTGLLIGDDDDMSICHNTCEEDFKPL